MTATQLDPSKLAEDALRSIGTVRLATLIHGLLPIEEQRDMARRFGLAPKGGFRVERAPVRILAPLLGESSDPRVVDEVCRRLAARLSAAPIPPSPDAGEAPALPDLEPILKLREQELGRLREQLAKARRTAAKQRTRQEDTTRELDAERAAAARLRSEIRDLRTRLEGRGLQPTVESEADQRIHELERELILLTETEQGLRRREAAQAAEIRRLEQENEQLLLQVPKGRRKKEPAPAAPPLAEHVRVPYFADSFYKSLEGKSRTSVERAVQAVLLLCVEGPAYPGLEVKQLEGTQLWSMRASLKLRVYFSRRTDGDVEVLALVDREDQHTMLRRLRER